MRKIINNEFNLKDSEIDMISKKVRALLINEQNEILLAKYADLYMLPGGKIDEGETNEIALKREIFEETGFDMSVDIMCPFFNIKSYLKDYPIRNTSKFCNRITDVTYYIVNINSSDLDLTNRKLTESEKENNFELSFVPLENIEDLLHNYNSTNPRKDFFHNKLLTVISEYKNKVK